MIKGDPVDVNIPVIKSNKLTESEIRTMQFNSSEEQLPLYEEAKK